MIFLISRVFTIFYSLRLMVFQYYIVEILPSYRRKAEDNLMVLMVGIKEKIIKIFILGLKGGLYLPQ